MRLETCICPAAWGPACIPCRQGSRHCSKPCNKHAETSTNYASSSRSLRYLTLPTFNPGLPGIFGNHGFRAETIELLCVGQLVLLTKHEVSLNKLANTIWGVGGTAPAASPSKALHVQLPVIRPLPLIRGSSWWLLCACLPLCWNLKKSSSLPALGKGLWQFFCRHQSTLCSGF